MSFRSIRMRIAIPYAILIAVVMVFVATFGLRFVREIYVDNLTDQLEAEARLIGQASRVTLLEDGAEQAQTLALQYGELIDQRVTFIDADGTVLGDTDSDPREMPSHLFRPEIRQALAEGLGVAIRYSETVGYEMVYVAVPLSSDQGTRAFVRVAIPLQTIDGQIRRLRTNILLVTGGVILIALALGFGIAESTARPIRRLTRVVQRMAQGDLSVRLLPHSEDEVGTLTRDFGAMADRLRTTIHDLEQERSEFAAILEHMADGILITDAETRIRMINPAARRILGVDQDDVDGRSFAQTVRDHQIIAVLKNCLRDRQEQIELVELGRRGPMLQVIATPLDAGGDDASCLMVFQDLSQVRRLETVRREFVSNISHELRTPLASLRALADTLRDGALEDPPAAHHFLNRIDAEVDSLTQMVQELLELSRIESGQVPLRLSPVPVVEIVGPAVERLRPQIERAGQNIDVVLSDDLPLILADTQRLQQVVINLVHNAIKFTPKGGSIIVHARHDKDRVVVSVTDTGEGIAPDVVPRIFERFYKADRSRSGGGTGLGLAIAKHIVQSHGGEIWVESIEGQGSTFSFSALTAET